MLTADIIVVRRGWLAEEIVWERALVDIDCRSREFLNGMLTEGGEAIVYITATILSGLTWSCRVILLSNKKRKMPSSCDAPLIDKTCFSTLENPEKENKRQVLKKWLF